MANTNFTSLGLYLSAHIQHNTQMVDFLFKKSFQSGKLKFSLRQQTFIDLFLLYFCIPPYWRHRILNHRTKSQMYHIQVSKHAPPFTISQYTFYIQHPHIRTSYKHEHIYNVICIQWHSSVSFLCEKFFVCETTFVAFFLFITSITRTLVCQGGVMLIACLLPI